MSPPKPSSTASVVQLDAREVPLQHGRRLQVVAAGAEDVVEISGLDGDVELRIRLTAEGPILQLQSVRLSLKAAEAIDVECETFKVRAREGVELSSQGPLRVQSDADVQVVAGGDVRVTGTLIHLN